MPEVFVHSKAATHVSLQVKSLSSNFQLVRLVHKELNVTRLESDLHMTPSYTDLQSNSQQTS
jgi:hypothetical protein